MVGKTRLSEFDQNSSPHHFALALMKATPPSNSKVHANECPISKISKSHGDMFERSIKKQNRIQFTNLYANVKQLRQRQMV